MGSDNPSVMVKQKSSDDQYSDWRKIYWGYSHKLLIQDFIIAFNPQVKFALMLSGIKALKIVNAIYKSSIWVSGLQYDSFVTLAIRVTGYCTACHSESGEESLDSSTSRLRSDDTGYALNRIYECSSN